MSSFLPYTFLHSPFKRTSCFTAWLFLGHFILRICSAASKIARSSSWHARLIIRYRVTAFGGEVHLKYTMFQKFVYTRPQVTCVFLLWSIHIHTVSRIYSTEWRMINKLTWILLIEVLPCHLPGRLKKTTKRLTGDTRCPDRDSYRTSPEYRIIIWYYYLDRIRTYVSYFVWMKCFKWRHTVVVRFLPSVFVLDLRYNWKDFD
jgi:hypothetical protein